MTSPKPRRGLDMGLGSSEQGHRHCDRHGWLSTGIRTKMLDVGYRLVRIKVSSLLPPSSRVPECYLGTLG